MVLAGAALLGTLGRPSGDEADPRHSIRLTGPNGERGLVELLGTLGIPAQARTRALFDLAHAAPPPAGDTLLAILAPWHSPTHEEARAVRSWVARGGRVLLAGYTTIEPCFGYQVVRASHAQPFAPLDGSLPPLRIPALKLRRGAAEPDERGEQAAARRRACPPLVPERVTTLLAIGATSDSAAKDTRVDTVALRLSYAGGGEVILLADPQLLANRGLKESSWGPEAVRWVLASGTSVVVFDEYHQGFSGKSTLVGATLRYVIHAPAGWTLLQIIVAALAFLALAAIRFGPPVAVVDRKRRGQLEHLDALAAGLERAHADDVARRLLVAGLRRRLDPSAPARAGSLTEWLAALERGARSDAARTRTHRLRRVMDAPGGASALAVASAVEDVWDSLKTPRPRTTS